MKFANLIFFFFLQSHFHFRVSEMEKEKEWDKIRKKPADVDLRRTPKTFSLLFRRMCGISTSRGIHQHQAVTWNDRMWEPHKFTPSRRFRVSLGCSCYFSRFFWGVAWKLKMKLCLADLQDLSPQNDDKWRSCLFRNVTSNWSFVTTHSFRKNLLFPRVYRFTTWVLYLPLGLSTFFLCQQWN